MPLASALRSAGRAEVVARVRASLPARARVALGAGVARTTRTLGSKRSGVLLLPPTSPGSLGDEAMMRACVTRLRRAGVSRVAAVAFAPAEHWPGLDIDMLDLSRYFSSGSLVETGRFAQKVAGYDAFWCLGADVLDGHYSRSGSLQRIRLCDIASAAGIEVKVLGFSFSDEADPACADALRALSPAVTLCARDPVSHARLVCATGRPVELVADSAFLLEPDPAGLDATLAWICGERAAGRRVVGINASHRSFAAAGDADPPRIAGAYAELIDTLVAAHAVSVLLLPHDVRETEREWSDVRLLDEVYRRVSHAARPHVRRDDRRWRAEQVRAAVAELDLVLTGRMHLAIASLGEGTPTLSLSYQGKFEGLYRELGLDPELALEPAVALRAGALEAFVVRGLAGAAAAAAALRSNVPAVVARAARNLEASHPLPPGRPRVLVITPEPTSPPVKGNRARILDLCERMEGRGIEVHIAEIERSDPERAAMLARWGERYHAIPYELPRARARRVSRSLGRLRRRGAYAIDDLYCPRADAFLSALAARYSFDGVMVEYVHQSAALRHFDGSVKIIDTHDLFSGRFAVQEGTPRQGFSTTEAEEGRGLDRADVVLAMQDVEREILQRLTTRPVVTIGHLVPVPAPVPGPDRRTVLFLGSRNQANVVSLRRFMTDEWPRLRQRVPDATLVIAGSVCGEVADVPAEGVERLGIVAAPSDAYAAADVVIAPVAFGTGMNIKVIEALGHGKPVVTTPVGAKGLERAAGHAFCVASTAEEMIDRLSELLGDAPQRAALGMRAREFAVAWNQASLDSFAGVLAAIGQRARGRCCSSGPTN
jgi:polysaccharide pyruvyl transferase WcaK-like protein/glycosyltransferase involved in cell wall biosynthesis